MLGTPRARETTRRVLHSESKPSDHPCYGGGDCHRCGKYLTSTLFTSLSGFQCVTPSRLVGGGDGVGSRVQPTASRPVLFWARTGSELVRRPHHPPRSPPRGTWSQVGVRPALGRASAAGGPRSITDTEFSPQQCPQFRRKISAPGPLLHPQMPSFPVPLPSEEDLDLDARPQRSQAGPLGWDQPAAPRRAGRTLEAEEVVPRPAPAQSPPSASPAGEEAKGAEGPVGGRVSPPGPRPSVAGESEG